MLEQSAIGHLMKEEMITARQSCQLNSFASSVSGSRAFHAWLNISLQLSSITDTPENGQSTLISRLGAACVSRRQIKSTGTAPHTCSSSPTDVPVMVSCMDLPTLTGESTTPNMTS